MAEVAVCPRCDGDKRVYNARSGRSEACPTCNAQGVVRVPELGEGSGSVESGSEHLDLTYRG